MAPPGPPIAARAPGLTGSPIHCGYQSARSRFSVHVATPGLTCAKSEERMVSRHLPSILRDEPQRLADCVLPRECPSGIGCAADEERAVATRVLVGRWERPVPEAQREPLKGIPLPPIGDSDGFDGGIPQAQLTVGVLGERAAPGADGQSGGCDERTTDASASCVHVGPSTRDVDDTSAMNAHVRRVILEPETVPMTGMPAQPSTSDVRTWRRGRRTARDRRGAAWNTVGPSVTCRAGNQDGCPWSRAASGARWRWDTTKAPLVAALAAVIFDPLPAGQSSCQPPQGPALEQA